MVNQINLNRSLHYSNFMDSVKDGKSLGNKVVLAKLPREEFTQFQHYCELNGETINSALRKIILAEIDRPRSIRLACKNVIEYNKNKDNFSWKITLDDNSIIAIDENLSADTAEQLYESLQIAIGQRNSDLKKRKKDSVAFPTKIMRKKDEK